MVISTSQLKCWIELLRTNLNEKVEQSDSLLTKDIIDTSQRLDILVSLYQRTLANAV